MVKFFFPLLFLTVNLLAQNQPNILFIIVDDLGYHDLSGHGSEIYQTPNIDQLAAESVEFTNAYANYPRCVPSRYALMTGKYPVVNGSVPDDGFPIENVPAERNFVGQFNEAGYRTAFLGKWHLGNEESSPKAMGYDVSVAAGKAGSPISYHYPFNTPKGHNRQVKKAPIEGLEKESKKGDYLTDILTEKVIDFIAQPNDNQPFMAVMSYYAVHQPLEAKEIDIARNTRQIQTHNFGKQPEYQTEGTGRTKLRQDNPEYAAMVENLDWNIGRILRQLDSLNLTENTIIIFTSDHGGLSNDGLKKRHLATANFPLRAGKGWMYEGGIKVPFFVKSPNFSARIDTQSVVMLMDVFPTMIDWVLNKKVADIDGESFLPVLKNKEIWDNRTVYWHASHARPQNTGESKSSVVRIGRWKLMEFYEKGVMELYNLKDDPYEQNNLAKTQTGIVQKLSAALIEWKKSW